MKPNDKLKPVCNYPCFRYNLKFEEKKVNSNNVERREQEEASSDDYSSTNEDEQVRDLEVYQSLDFLINKYSRGIAE